MAHPNAAQVATAVRASPGVHWASRLGGAAGIGAIVSSSWQGAVDEAARTQQPIDKVLASVALASVLGRGLFGLINLLSYLGLRRLHASERS